MPPLLRRQSLATKIQALGTVFILLFCLLPLPVKGSAPLKPRDTLLFAVENNWPPYASASGHGISVTLVSQAFNVMGIDTHFLVLPYSRVLQATESGSVIGGFNVTRQSSTEKSFIFGETPLLLAPASYYFRTGEADRFHSINDLPDNTRIGLIIGYEYGNEFEAQRHRFNEVRVPKQKQLIKMLIKKRVDTIILFDKVADYTVAKMAKGTTPIERGMKSQDSEIFVAFSKTHKNAAAIAKQLDQGLVILKQQGKYDAILRGESLPITSEPQ